MFYPNNPETSQDLRYADNALEAAAMLKMAAERWYEAAEEELSHDHPEYAKKWKKVAKILESASVRLEKIGE